MYFIFQIVFQKFHLLYRRFLVQHSKHLRDLLYHLNFDLNQIAHHILKLGP